MQQAPETYIRMIEQRIQPNGYNLSSHVREAFLQIPRDRFVLVGDINKAYLDKPLHILSGQTISAPSMYALMLSTDLGDPKSNMNVLEVGTGSGYGAALLAWVVGEEHTFTIERHKELIEFAISNLKKVSMTRVNVIHGNGTESIPDLDFDRIIVTASGTHLPDIYLHHLKQNGRIIMPITNEKGEQWIWKISKSNNGEIQYKRKMQVLFVPLIYKDNLEEII